MATKLFNEDGKPLYKIYTKCGTSKFGGEPIEFFNVKASPDYVKVLEKAAAGKLGECASGKMFIPEHFHTMDMLAEALVAKADDEGVIETVDKEVALLVLRQAPWSKLDAGSPQEILNELSEEVKVKTSLEARKANIDKAKERLLKNKIK